MKEFVGLWHRDTPVEEIVAAIKAAAEEGQAPQPNDTDSTRSDAEEKPAQK